MYQQMDDAAEGHDTVILLGRPVPRRKAEQGCSCCTIMMIGALLTTVFLFPRQPGVRASQVELGVSLADPGAENILHFNLNETMVFKNHNYYPMQWEDLDISVQFCIAQAYPFSYIDNRCLENGWVTIGTTSETADFTTSTRGTKKLPMLLDQVADLPQNYILQMYCNINGFVDGLLCGGLPETAYAYTALLRTTGTVKGHGRYHNFGTIKIVPPAINVFNVQQ